MQHNQSSPFLNKRTSRRSFTKAAMLAPVVGVLGGVVVRAEPWLAHAQGSITSVQTAPTQTVLVPRTEVFAFSDDNKLYHKFYFNGVWSIWMNINPDDAINYESSPPTVAVVGQTIHLFTFDTANNLLWLNSPYNGNWSNWTILGQPAGYDDGFDRLAVTTQGDGTLDLFVRGTKSGPGGPKDFIQDTHVGATPPRMKKSRIRRGDTSSKIVVTLGPRASSKTD